MKICIVSFGISHVIIAISCVLTYNIVFQMAIKNWTKELNWLDSKVQEEGMIMSVLQQGSAIRWHVPCCKSTDFKTWLIIVV